MRRILDALGLSEDKDAGKFLTGFDAMLTEAVITDAMVIHHMGHSGERARGDSTILGWGDSLWKMVRKDEDPASQRYFSAFGRDVDVQECELSYDATTRSLTITGAAVSSRSPSTRLVRHREVHQGASGPVTGRSHQGVRQETKTSRSDR